MSVASNLYFVIAATSCLSTLSLRKVCCVVSGHMDSVLVQQRSMMLEYKCQINLLDNSRIHIYVPHSDGVVCELALSLPIFGEGAAKKGHVRGPACSRIIRRHMQVKRGSARFFEAVNLQVLLYLLLQPLALHTTMASVTDI